MLIRKRSSGNPTEAVLGEVLWSMFVFLIRLSHPYVGPLKRPSVGTCDTFETAKNLETPMGFTHAPTTPPPHAYKHLLRRGPKLVALPLYGALSSDAAQRVFEEVDELDVRKVVVATNIAETSITVPGVKYVVDPGYVKLKGYDPSRAFSASSSRFILLLIQNVLFLNLPTSRVSYGLVSHVPRTSRVVARGGGGTLA